MSRRLADGLLLRVARFLVQHPKLCLALILVYLVIPFDAVPEALFGPLGYVEDGFLILLPVLARAYLNRRERRPRVIDTTLEE